MNDRDLTVTHRQLVSAIICLCDGNSRSAHPLSTLGYTLNALELPLVDHFGRSYRLDLHLVNSNSNISLLVDCKTYAGNLDEDQVSKYLSTTGQEAVNFGRLALDNPRQHRADTGFFVLDSVVSELARIVRRCDTSTTSGWGIVNVESARIVASHNEFSDTALGESLSNGWPVEIMSLELERLPFEPDSPTWELAEAVFQTLVAFFVIGIQEFGVEELCEESNSLWPYLESHHGHIRNRVRHLVSSARRTSLKEWIRRVDQPSGREERWRFLKRPTTNQRTIEGLRNRNAKYVRILFEEKRDPRRVDFEPEQLTLPLENSAT